MSHIIYDIKKKNAQINNPFEYWYRYMECISVIDFLIWAI